MEEGLYDTHLCSTPEMVGGRETVICSRMHVRGIDDHQYAEMMIDLVDD